MPGLKQIFSSPLSREAQELYVEVVRQSRSPRLYTEFGIPDTAEGRFESLVLHLFLAQHGLKNGGSRERHLSRRIAEAFITDMDRTLREVGIGDTGVGKRVKKAAQGMLARVAAYGAAFDDREQFTRLIGEYVYTGMSRDPKLLADYIYERHLRAPRAA